MPNGATNSLFIEKCNVPVFPFITADVDEGNNKQIVNPLLPSSSNNALRFVTRKLSFVIKKSEEGPHFHEINANFDHTMNIYLNGHKRSPMQ